MLFEQISADIVSAMKAKDKVRLMALRNVKKYFIENVDKNIKVAILYSENKIFAVNQSKVKDLHSRFEGELYNIDEI